MKRRISQALCAVAAVALISVGAIAQQARKASKTTANTSAIAEMAKPAVDAKEATFAPVKTVSTPHGVYSPSTCRLTLPEANPMTTLRNATGVVNMIGNVVYSDNGVHVGLYELGSDGSFGQNLNPSVEGNLGACVVDGIYYSMCQATNGVSYTYTIYAYDMENGYAQLSARTLPTTAVTTALMYDGSNVYGVFPTSTSGKYNFGTLNLETLAVTTIAQVNANIHAGAVDKDGNLWGIFYGNGTADQYLAKINKQTGVITKVGTTLGVDSKYLSGAAIDPDSGRMFWMVCPADETGNLYEVNMTTGVATKLAQYAASDEITGLYIPGKVEADAPAKPENLTLSFPNGALTGKVSFKVPTKTTGGNTGSGDVTYKVYENGNQIATGKTAFGQDVNVNVTVSVAATYTYKVELSNAAGTGPTATASMFIGNDTPAAPASVTASYAANGTMTISWQPVTKGANDGYIDPAKVTYTVKNEGRVVKENITATSCTEQITLPESGRGSYTYTVTATFMGNTSAAAESNRVNIGGYSVPCSFVINSEEVFDEFEVFDANHDDKTWKFSSTTTLSGARCQYNSAMDMDDWLFTPSISMEAGKNYKLTAEIFNNSTAFTEKYEITIGQGATVAAQTKTLKGATEVKTKELVPEDILFTVPASGNYNVAVHGISAKDQFYLYVVSLVLTEVDGNIPNTVTDLVVTPDPAGALSAKIDFKAPSTSINGKALTAITKIDVKNGNEIVKSFANPTPGAALTCTHTPSASGTYKYDVVVYTAAGQSQPVSGSAFVGFDKVNAPTDVTMVETSTLGKVKITWKAPTTDAAGKPVNAANITYQLRETNESYTLIRDLGNVLECEEVVVEAGECAFAQFAIFPVHQGEIGTGALTPFIVVGTPYSLPYREGFDPIAYPLGLQMVNGTGEWTLFKSSEDLPSADGDNAFIAFKAGGLDAASILHTAKVDLTNVESPMLAFYTYNVTGDATDPTKNNINEVNVVIREPNASEWTVVTQPATVHSLCGGVHNTWGRVTVDLTPYKGKVMQIGLKACCKFYTYTMFDKLSITNALNDNLSAESIDAPSTTPAGKEFTVKVKVANDGKNAASRYNVELYELGNDTPVKSVEVTDHAAYTDKIVELPMTYAPGQAGEHTLYAKVVYSADQNADDNTTDGVIVKVNVSAKAAPNSLAVTLDAANDEHVNLTWAAPAPASAPRMANAITDDLESYDAWKYDGAGDWKFIDKDGKASGGFQNMELPGLTIGTSVTSFFTFSKTTSGGNDTFAAHSGDKYFAAMFLYDDSQSNDWLISPMLSGNAQTISFWARSYSTSYPEKIEVYASTGSDNPDDFTAVSGSLVASVPGTWTKYEVALPAGTKYFAVRSFATGSFMLMLDDFTYEPGDAAPAALVGYNVYRNHQKVNSEIIPVGTTSFKDTSAEPGTTHNYYVTAVYDNGEESGASNTASITTSVPGLSMADVTVSVDNNTIVVENATETVTVTDMGGVVIFRGTGNRIVVAVNKGAYIVRTGKFTQKVMVK